MGLFSGIRKGLKKLDPTSGSSITNKVIDPLDILGFKKKKEKKEALKESRKEQEAAVEEQKKLYTPYTQAGEGALRIYQQLLGLTPKDETTPDVGELIRKTPGYEFQVGEEERAMQRLASAGGYRGSGRLYDELMSRAGERASGYYGAYMGGLEQLIGVGQASAVGMATATQSGASARIAEIIGRANASAEQRGAMAGTVGTVLGAYFGGPMGASAGSQAGRQLGGGTPMQNPYALTGSSMDLSYQGGY